MNYTFELFHGKTYNLVKIFQLLLFCSKHDIELSISYGSKDIVNVQVDNRQTNKQTGQNQYEPDHSFWGHKNVLAYQRLWLPSLLCDRPAKYKLVIGFWVLASLKSMQQLVKIQTYSTFRQQIDKTQGQEQLTQVFGQGQKQFCQFWQ